METTLTPAQIEKAERLRTAALGAAEKWRDAITKGEAVHERIEKGVFPESAALPVLKNLNQARDVAEQALNRYHQFLKEMGLEVPVLSGQEVA